MRHRYWHSKGTGKGEVQGEVKVLTSKGTYTGTSTGTVYEVTSIGRLVQVQIYVEIIGTVNWRDPHLQVQVQAGALVL